VTALQLQSRDRLIERALDHLRQAIAEGEPRRSIANDFCFRSVMARYPSLSDLDRPRTRRGPSFYELRLLDPIDLPR
jgi:hypothetical protein